MKSIVIRNYKIANFKLTSAKNGGIVVVKVGFVSGKGVSVGDAISIGVSVAVAVDSIDACGKVDGKAAICPQNRERKENKRDILRGLVLLLVSHTEVCFIRLSWLVSQHINLGP